MQEKLTQIYFRLTTGLHAMPVNNEREETAALDDAGWDADQITDIHFLREVIDKSTPYLPRGGYSSQSPGKFIEPLFK